jgi:hypothetical protein
VPAQVDTTSGDVDGATFFDHAETDLY